MRRPVRHGAVICLAFVVALSAFAQRTNGKKDAPSVFADIQRGIAAGNVSLFSGHFHAQVHVTLNGGESGLFSANQAYYLLQNYFRERKPVSFSFSTSGGSESSPYATGSAAFNLRGAREHAQIYVALAVNGDRWVITHINVY